MNIQYPPLFLQANNYLDGWDELNYINQVQYPLPFDANNNNSIFFLYCNVGTTVYTQEPYIYPTYQYIDPRDYIIQNETVSESVQTDNPVDDISRDNHTQSTLTKKYREYKPYNFCKLIYLYRRKVKVLKTFDELPPICPLCKKNRVRVMRKRILKYCSACDTKEKLKKMKKIAKTNKRLRNFLKKQNKLRNQNSSSETDYSD